MDISYTDIICRTCMLELDTFRSIFKLGKVREQMTTVAEMLKELTSLEYVEGDGLPQNICDKCILQLSRAYVFRQTCLASDVQFREKLQETQNNENEEQNVSDEISGTVYFFEQVETENNDSKESHSMDHIRYNIKPVAIKEEETVEEAPPTAEEQDQNDVSMVIEQLENDDHDLHFEILHDEADVSVDDSGGGTDGRGGIDGDGDTGTISDTKYNTEEGKVYRKRRQRTRKIPGPPFKCDICEKILSNHSSYKYHMQLHSDYTPYLCSECGEGFKTRNAYDGHMMTHNKDNPHTCHMCGKAYRQAGSLRCHMLTHTGEKPYVCDLCGKGTTQKSGYKKHMLTHTGEKPHECNICGKEFRYSSNLIIHKRGHTGERPYKCSVNISYL